MQPTGRNAHSDPPTISHFEAECIGRGGLSGARLALHSCRGEVKVGDRVTEQTETIGDRGAPPAALGNRLYKGGGVFSLENNSADGKCKNPTAGGTVLRGAESCLPVSHHA